MIQFLVRVLFLVHSQLSSCVTVTQKGRGGSLGSFQKASILFVRDLLSWPDHLPLAALPNNLPWGLVLT